MKTPTIKKAIDLATRLEAVKHQGGNIAEIEMKVEDIPDEEMKQYCDSNNLELHIPDCLTPRFRFHQKIGVVSITFMSPVFETTTTYRKKPINHKEKAAVRATA